VNAKAGSSSSSGLSGDSSGRSDISRNERAEASGGSGSPQEPEVKVQPAFLIDKDNPKNLEDLRYDGIGRWCRYRPIRIRKRGQQHSFTGCRPCPLTATATTQASRTLRQLSCGPAQASPSLRRQARPGMNLKKSLPRGKSPNGSGSFPGYWTPSVPTLNLPRSLCNRSSPLTCC